MIKVLVRIASCLFPGVVVERAYRVLTNPQVHKLRAHEGEVLDRAKRSHIRFNKFRIQVYEWGNSRHERVLLVHGWEGQAGNFADLIPHLLERNFHIVAFDGPAHGFSSRGQTSFFEFSALVSEMIRRYECRKLISHSFGGVATTYALAQHPELEIDRYVLLTVPDRFSQRIDAVVRQVGTTRRVKRLLVERMEREMDVRVGEVNVSNFVRAVNVKRALILHDKKDRVIPLTQAQSVAANWRQCTLDILEGTGHFRILRTPRVAERVVAFMTDDQ